MSYFPEISWHGFLDPGTIISSWSPEGAEKDPRDLKENLVPQFRLLLDSSSLNLLGFMILIHLLPMFRTCKAITSLNNLSAIFSFSSPF